MSFFFELGFVGYDGAEYFRARQSGSSAAPVDVPVQPSAPADAPTDAAGSGSVTFITAPDIPRPTPTRAPTTLPVPQVDADPAFAAADYGVAAQALLPTGRVWPREPDGVQAKVLGAIGETLARSDASARALLAGSLPGALTQLLPEWEATLGLPDPCLGDMPTIDQRLAQVRARFTDRGGMSRARLIAFAAALGFAIELVVYAPFRAGASTTGSALVGDEAFDALGIRIVSNDGALPADALICELRAIAPAEADLILLS